MDRLLLIPAVLTVPGFALAGRIAGRRAIDPLWLALLTFSLAVLPVAAAAAWVHPPSTLAPFLTPRVLWIPLLAGVASGVGTWLYYAAVATGPVGPVATICGMQLLVPILVFTLFFRERLTVSQGVGAGLAFVAMTLINLGERKERSGAALTWASLSLLVLMLGGVSLTAMKYVHVAAPDMPDMLYLCVVYAAAAAVAATLVAARGPAPLTGSTVVLGATGAVLTIVQLYCMVAALRTLPSTLVYLSVFGGGPILVVLMSALLLHERYGLRVWTATVAGICGICMLLL